MAVAAMAARVVTATMTPSALLLLPDTTGPRSKVAARAGIRRSKAGSQSMKRRAVSRTAEFKIALRPTTRRTAAGPGATSCSTGATMRFIPKPEIACVVAAKAATTPMTMSSTGITGIAGAHGGSPRGSPSPAELVDDRSAACCVDWTQAPACVTSLR
jgi:hypothetical protein